VPRSVMLTLLRYQRRFDIMVVHVIGGAILFLLCLWGYNSIPAEDPKNVAARQSYGKVGD